jgi:uncharacterized Zn-finger protein
MGYKAHETSLMLRCPECKKQYDLIKLKRILERKNISKLHCPYCAKQIGELN